jgi:flagellar basal body-associated protein FliL
MTKKLLIVIGALVGMAMLAGDGVAGWLLLTRQDSGKTQVAAASAGKPTPQPPPQPHGMLHFAELDKFVVSLANGGDNAPSYAQVNLSFSSYNAQALKTFDEVRPMIKAAVISSIMANAGQVATGSSAARKVIIADALAAANSIVTQQDPKIGSQPFVGAFLTDFVLQ